MAVRTTRQRREVAALLEEVSGFRTAQEIHALLREHGSSIGLATVYRTLAGMAERNEVDAMSGPAGGETRYRSCSAGHHHHLTCRRCGHAVEVELEQIEAWCDTMAGAHGFVDVRHTVEIDGLCSECA